MTGGLLLATVKKNLEAPKSIQRLDLVEMHKATSSVLPNVSDALLFRDLLSAAAREF